MLIENKDAFNGRLHDLLEPKFTFLQVFLNFLYLYIASFFGKHQQNKATRQELTIAHSGYDAEYSLPFQA